MRTFKEIFLYQKHNFTTFEGGMLFSKLRANYRLKALNKFMSLSIRDRVENIIIDDENILNIIFIDKISCDEFNKYAKQNLLKDIRSIIDLSYSQKLTTEKLEFINILKSIKNIRAYVPKRYLNNKSLIRKGLRDINKAQTEILKKIITTSNVRENVVSMQIDKNNNLLILFNNNSMIHEFNKEEKELMIRNLSKSQDILSPKGFKDTQNLLKKIKNIKAMIKKDFSNLESQIIIKEDINNYYESCHGEFQILCTDADLVKIFKEIQKAIKTNIKEGY